MRKRRSVLAVLLALALMLAAFGAASADGYGMTYGGADEYGQIVGNAQTCVFKLTDSEARCFFAYCIDQAVYANGEVKYKRTNLADADYFEEGAADCIRAVVQNAYPFVTLERLQAESGVSECTAADAVTAAQLAIWHYSDKSDYALTGPVAALYDYFVGLDKAAAATAPIANIEILPVFEARRDGVRATFQYRAVGKNADGSAIDSAASLSKDVEALYGADVTRSENGEYHVLTVDGLPADATFECVVTAEQTVSNDAYFYSPEGGRTASQSLVGMYEGKTALSRAYSFRYETPDGFSVRIKKVDSLTLSGLSGAVFEVCNREDFDSGAEGCLLYELTTDDGGCASVSGLTEGIWYVREKTPPKGYIPYEGVFPVEVYQYTREQVYKNTAYGALEIVKTDENANPVAGATFSIYQGEAVTERAPLYSGLVTDDAGTIFTGELIPGEYTVLETAAPEGYHLNDTPVTVSVEPGAKAVAAIENETVKRGTLLLYKRDAVTTEQLSGCVIGVYSDESFETKLCEVTTGKTEPISVTDLMPGTYYVKELKAPDGYLLDSSPQTVELVEGATAAVTFYNNEPPKTAGNYGILLLIGGVSLAATCVGVFLLRKKLFASRRP